MLPPEAEKKMQCWIRSRHLICSGNLYVFETVDYSAVERFAECVTTLGLMNQIFSSAEARS